MNIRPSNIPVTVFVAAALVTSGAVLVQLSTSPAMLAAGLACAGLGCLTGAHAIKPLAVRIPGRKARLAR